MAVTAVRAGIGMHEAEDLPGGELLVHALPELSDGAHTPEKLATRELRIAGTSKRMFERLFASEKWSVLTCVNTENPGQPYT